MLNPMARPFAIAAKADDAAAARVRRKIGKKSEDFFLPAAGPPSDPNARCSRQATPPAHPGAYDRAING